MADNWKAYQEEAATFFRTLGLSAETDVTIEGVRTTHDIDVVVRSKHVGFEILWLVECKFWKTPVSKLHVLGLREIVSDIGADRGIVLSESGFQSGAIEAANLTNVQVTSLATLSVEASNDISAMLSRELFDRVEACKDSYWELSKGYRIATGLRADTFEDGYSGAFVMDYCRELLSCAFRGKFPMEGSVVGQFIHANLPSTFSDVSEIIAVVEPLIQELEGKLQVAHAGLSKPK